MERTSKHPYPIEILRKSLPLTLLGFLVVMLVYTRLVNVTWGFPYLMHPDENNMMSSIMQLSCSFQNPLDCLNPRFFAYGQLMLYLGSAIANLIQRLTFSPVMSPLFVSLSLRLISAVSSIVGGIVLYRLIAKQIRHKWAAHIGLALYVFTPAFIQQAHFGTTESLLTTLLLLTVYAENNLLLQGIFVGLAIAAKPSGALFAIVPLLTLLGFLKKTRNLWHFLIRGLLLSLTVIIVTVLSSPHYFINLKYLIGTFNYESAVAQGTMRVFYTQQFQNTVPILFQLQKILPYAIGWCLTVFGFAGLVYALKKHTKLALVFVFLFGYSALLYAKWTRFIIPFTPFLIFFSISLLLSLHKSLRTRKLQILSTVLIATMLVYQTVIGVSFVSIYATSDVRFQASDWILSAITKDSSMLSESANVVDIPLGHHGEYRYFNPFLNDLDTDVAMRKRVNESLDRSDYVLVPSRRVFANYTCYRNFGYTTPRGIATNSTYQSVISLDRNCGYLTAQYPALRAYYDRLFSQNNSYELVAEFSSFPKLRLFGITLVEFPDEAAEETWTVFDHPVVRLYKRIAAKP